MSRRNVDDEESAHESSTIGGDFDLTEADAVMEIIV